MTTDSSGLFCIFCHAANPTYTPVTVTEIDRRDASITGPPDAGGDPGWSAALPRDAWRTFDRNEFLKGLSLDWNISAPDRPECDFEMTPHVIGHYRLWFKQYAATSPGNLIFGCWLAWPDPRIIQLEHRNAHTMRFLFSACGSDAVGEYQRGANIPGWDQVSTTKDTPPEERDVLRELAYGRLEAYVNSALEKSE